MHGMRWAVGMGPRALVSTGRTVSDAGVSGASRARRDSSWTRRAATASKARQVVGRVRFPVADAGARPHRVDPAPGGPAIPIYRQRIVCGFRRRVPGTREDHPIHRRLFRFLRAGLARPHRRHPGAPSFSAVFGGGTVTRGAWTDSSAFRDFRPRSPPAAPGSMVTRSGSGRPAMKENRFWGSPVSDGTRRFFDRQAGGTMRRSVRAASRWMSRMPGSRSPTRTVPVSGQAAAGSRRTPAPSSQRWLSVPSLPASYVFFHDSPERDC